jgi:glycine cleavage system pyridoxal-binding protein P
MYAVYHGPEGLRRDRPRVHGATARRRRRGSAGSASARRRAFFDTLRVDLSAGRDGRGARPRAEARGINLRADRRRRVGIALDETVTARPRGRCSSSSAAPQGRDEPAST